MNRLIKFIRYDNAVPLSAIGIVFFAGGVFAASPEARDAIVSTETSIVAVDNSYILHKDLSTFNPNVAVTGVTEDEETYFVAYTLTTIDLVSGVWQDVAKQEIIKVSKELLGERDLGLFVSEQLREVLARQVVHLAEVQEFEKRNGVSAKTVATEYSGLIGKMLDPKIEVFEGYEPVIDSPDNPVLASEQAESVGEGIVAGVSTSEDHIPPVITVLGANPVYVKQGSTYHDLGATAVDNGSSIVDIVVFDLDLVDINTIGVYFITYKAYDQNSNIAMAKRTVLVEAPTSAPIEGVASTTDPAPSVEEGSTDTVGDTVPVDATSTEEGVPTPTPKSDSDTSAESVAPEGSPSTPPATEEGVPIEESAPEPSPTEAVPPAEAPTEE